MKLSEALRLGIPRNDWVCIVVNRLAVLVLIGVLARILPPTWSGFAAQDRVIASPDRLQMVTLSVMKDMNGTNVAALFKAHFVSIEAKPSGEVTTVQTGSYEVDLLKSNDSVVVGGEQYYDKEIWDAVAAIAQREFNKANPSALPQRRRALRGQP